MFVEKPDDVVDGLLHVPVDLGIGDVAPHTPSVGHFFEIVHQFTGGTARHQGVPNGSPGSVVVGVVAGREEHEGFGDLAHQGRVGSLVGPAFNADGWVRRGTEDDVTACGGPVVRIGEDLGNQPPTPAGMRRTMK